MKHAVKRWMRLQNPKYAFLYQFFKNDEFTLLDIGAGNHSASKTVSLFTQCNYYGVDLDKNYNNNEADFAVMKGFYEMDLTKLEFDAIPDNFFDAILLVHVIEHLANGDEVLAALVSKLKIGGVMYVEYPGRRSLTLPSMKGTLNYYDDASHVRLYTIEELSELFLSKACSILSAGNRRSLFLLLMTPIRVVLRWLRGKAVTGNIFWDLLGFAEYVAVVREC
ncbi:MAG: class I SAM-dependent methyltransferase [Chitinophagaceae bacterium]|jgi:SAM-dependent methyltransferase